MALSPTLDPATLEAMLHPPRGVNDEHVVEAYRDLRDAHGTYLINTMRAAHRELEEFDAKRTEIQQRIGRDETVKDIFKPGIVRQEVAKVRETATKKFREGIETLRRRVSEDVERALFDAEAVFRPEKPPAEAGEVRAHVKALSPEGRLRFIDERAKAGDTESLAAVFGGKPFLSGLEHIPPERLDTLREDAARKVAPEKAARLDAARRLSAHFEHMGAALAEM